MSDNGSPRLTDKLRQRGQDMVALLSDPIDGGALQRDGTHRLLNPVTNQHYAIVENVVRLASPQQLAELEPQAKRNADQFLSKGWLAPDIEEFRRLPQTGIPSWSEEYWATRAAVVAEMWRILEQIRIEEDRLPIAPMGIAADISDGMGWVGYGLDVSGYITVVVSPYSGPYGLDVFPFSRYLRVLADPTTPPLSQNSFDLVTISFCLHNISAPQDLLTHASRLLKPNGLLMVLSADETDLASATQILEAVGLSTQQQRVRALGNGIGRAVKNILQRGPDVPPILMGRRKI